MQTEFKRALIPADLRALLTFDRRVFRKSDLFEAEDWKRDESWWMVVDGVRVGCCAFERNVDFQEDIRSDEHNVGRKGSLYISTTGILPTFQDSGFGGLFKAWQLQYARFHNFRRIVTNCRKRNVGIIALNTKVGFRVLRTTPKYYTEPTDATVVMELQLRRR